MYLKDFREKILYGFNPTNFAWQTCRQQKSKDECASYY